MWFIRVEVEQETSAPPSKKNHGSAPVGNCRQVRKVFKIQIKAATTITRRLVTCALYRRWSVNAMNLS